MAKSKIIKELANGEIDVVKSLKRLKILLYDIEKPEIKKWIDNELAGYSENDKVPAYRIFEGFLQGDYFANLTVYTKALILTTDFDEDFKEFCTKVKVKYSIKVLQDKDQDIQYVVMVPAESYELITKGARISSLRNARINFDQTAPQAIIAAVEGKVLEILLLLEKEFGNLDELDIDISNETPEHMSEVAKQIINIIYYNDNSINIGDSNKISNSEIKNNTE